MRPDGAANARFLNDTLQNCGADGIHLNAASALLDNSRIRSNAGAGMSLIGNSSVQGSDNTIGSNGSCGLSLDLSTAVLNTTRITTNGTNAPSGLRYGIYAKSSRLRISGGEIALHPWSGIQLVTGSAITVDDASITGNGTDTSVIENLRRGVSLSQSAMDIGNSSVANNSGRGIAIEDRSSANFRNTSVTGNGSHGVEAYLGATTSINGGTISGNGDSGVWLWVNSTAQIIGPIAIRNNANHGIDLNADSKLWVWNPITVGGNVGRGVQCNDAGSSAGNLAFVAYVPANGAGTTNCSGY